MNEETAMILVAMVLIGVALTLALRHARWQRRTREFQRLLTWADCEDDVDSIQLIRSFGDGGLREMEHGWVERVDQPSQDFEAYETWTLRLTERGRGAVDALRFLANNQR